MNFRMNVRQPTILLLFLVASVAPVTADQQGAGPKAPQQSEPYVIQRGERLKVVILARPDISGEYQVDMAGDIALPTVGAVVAEGFTAQQLGMRISEFVAQSTGESTSASVTLLEYRPVYVVGDVKESGSYPFLPGMTALQAAAMAGGIFDAGQNSSGDGRQALEAEYMVLSIRRQRLLAEKQHLQSLELTPSLNARIAGDPLLSALVDAEERLLEKREEELELKLQGHQQSRDLFDKEAQALVKQIEVQERLRELLEQQSRAVKDLRDKGMVSQTNYLDLERQATATNNDQRATEAYLARARQSSDAARQSALELELAWQQDLEQAISENARDLLRLERQIAGTALGDVVFDADAVECAPGHSSAGGPRAMFKIIRTNAGREEKIVHASRSESLYPGDVVAVSIHCNDPTED